MPGDGRSVGEGGDLVDHHAAAGDVGGGRVPGRAEHRIERPRRADLDGGRELGDQLAFAGLRGGRTGPRHHVVRRDGFEQGAFQPLGPRDHEVARVPRQLPPAVTSARARGAAPEPRPAEPRSTELWPPEPRPAEPRSTELWPPEPRPAEPRSTELWPPEPRPAEPRSTELWPPERRPSRPRLRPSASPQAARVACWAARSSRHQLAGQLPSGQPGRRGRRRSFSASSPGPSGRRTPPSARRS